MPHLVQMVSGEEVVERATETHQLRSEERV